MNQQDNYMPTPERLMRGQFNQNAVATMLIAGYLLLLSWLFFTSRGEGNLNRAIFSTFIFMLLGFAWWSQVMSTKAKAIPWQRLAAQTGLHCIIGGFWTGYSVEIRGDYRKRALKMYTRNLGNGQIEMTRIELSVTPDEQTSLKLRGPFTQKEILYDRVTLQMMGDVAIQKAGASSHFLLGTDSQATMQVLQSDNSLWDEVAQLRQLTTIELRQNNLIFEQAVLVRDVGKLHMIYDLLSDLADTLEND